MEEIEIFPSLTTLTKKVQNEFQCNFCDQCSIGIGAFHVLQFQFVLISIPIYTVNNCRHSIGKCFVFFPYALEYKIYSLKLFKLHITCKGYGTVVSLSAGSDESQILIFVFLFFTLGIKASQEANDSSISLTCYVKFEKPRILVCS